MSRTASAIFGSLMLCALLLLVAPHATAASLRTEVGARQVGVGQRFVVRVTAVQGDGDETPSSPQLQINGAADIQGPNVATQTSMRMHNFSVTHEQSVVATWIVTPTAKGQLTIGPATFVLGNKQLRGETIVVRVDDAPNAGPQTGRPDPFNPFSFDPFSFRRGAPTPQASYGLNEAPVELELERAPHPIAFLRAVPSKRKVVVGEAFTLEIYAYGSRGQFREVSPTEPSTSDFLSFPVVEHSQEEPPYVTTIGDEQWFLVKLRELVLVPLRSGKTSIGGMEAFVNGPGYPARGSRYGMKVTCAPLDIEVVEPPLEGRPEGYLLGDVGRLGLQAELSSRKLAQGDYLQLVVRVKGSGSLPSRVQLPSLPGLEWQEPALEGGPKVRDGKLGGTRTLKIAGRVNQAGTLDLGDVTLPYYDPTAREYRIARAALGSLEVTPSTAAAARPSSTDPAPPSAARAGPPLAPRKALADWSPARASWIRPGYWWTLVLLPASVALGRLFLALARSWRSRSAAGPTREQTLRQALSLAKQSAAAGDFPATVRHLERALYEAVEEASGVRARGVLRAHVESVLVDADLEAALAAAVGGAIVELEALRYEPGDKTATGLVEQVAAVLKKLQKHKRPSALDRSARRLA